MIRLEHLSKNFGTRCALEPLSLEIPQGQIFGLLGHNGAGKSTTFGMILGQVHPTSGSALIRGVSVQKERKKALHGVGAIFETPAFYDYLSGWTNLRILTAYSGGVPEAAMREAVRFTGLEGRIQDPVRVYSHGMRQRLALAQALLPRPELVLLDEPAEGLDPEGIAEMRELILRLNREQGMTVVLSSHLLSEVEQICDRIAVLKEGRLIFEGQWTELAGEGQRFRLEVDDWDKAAAVAAALPGFKLGLDHVLSMPAEGDVSILVAALVREGVKVRALEPVRQGLEEIYLGMVSAK